MEFLFLLVVAGVAASSISWLLSRRTDLPPVPGAPRYRVALSIGWYATLAKSTWLAAPFIGLMGGLLATIPLAFLISSLATPATEMRYIGPLFLLATSGGVVLGLRFGHKARRAPLPHLEIYQDRMVIPVSGPLDAAVRTVIPFSELTSVSAVRDDFLVVNGRRSWAIVRAADIASITNIPGIRDQIEAAVRESIDGGELAPRMAEETAATEALAERSSLATNVILSMIAAGYALQWLAYSSSNWAESLVRLGANVEDSWRHGHAYRLVSANYLHASLIHLLSNVSALATFGLLVEKLLGRARTLVIYGASTILGSFASSLVDPLAVGASTGVFGLMAAIAVTQLRHGHSLPRAFQLDRQSWFFLVLANAALPLLIPNISWAGHLGGAIAGGITAAVVARSVESIDGSAAGFGTRVVAASLVVVHLLAIWQAAHFFVSPLDFPPIPTPQTRS